MKKFKFPNPFTVLYIIIILSAIATFLMPAGSFSTLSYDAGNFLIEGKENTVSLKASQSVLDSLNLKMELSKFEEGKIRKPVSIPNTYAEMESSPQGLMAIVYAPIKGIYESIDIILFVLIIGGFIGVFTASGAFDRGLSSLSEKMKGREKWLIVAVMVLVAIGGTTFGMQEETIAFYPILVPIFLAAGYDLIVPVGALYGGSCIGLMGAMINPFETIIASDAAGVSWTLGIYSRLAMFILGGIVVITYVLRYAEKVKKDPKQSLLYNMDIKQPFSALKKTEQTEKLNLKTQLLLVLFGLTFVIMVYGVSSLGWWFEEMTALFFWSVPCS